MTAGGRRPGRRVIAWLALAALSTAVVLVTMSRSRDPSAGPTILLSLDRTLWHRLGLSRFTYIRSLERAGAEVRVFDFVSGVAGAADQEFARRLLEGVDGLALSGGGDVDPRLYGGRLESSLEVRPERDRFELALLREAEARGLPVLGICRGAQLINVARGGTLRNIREDPELRRRHRRLRGHAVELVAGSRLARLLGTERIGRVVTYHGQAVERPGEGLEIVGRAGDGVVEAIELAGDGARWLIGVQWHPELSPVSRQQRKLFAGLVAAARRSDVAAGSS